jgi:hypothetical protein
MDKLMVLVNPQNKAEKILPDMAEVVDKVNEIVEAVNRIEAVMKRLDEAITSYLDKEKIK